MKTIEEIREAFHKIHDVATGKSDRAYMSIPADRERDADLILSEAIKELETARDRLTVLDRQLLGFRLAAKGLLRLIDDVPIDPKLGDETDRVFPRWEFDELRMMVEATEPPQDPRVQCSLCEKVFPSEEAFQKHSSHCPA